VNLFRGDMLERVFAASRDPELLANVQALDRWLDDAIAAFAQAFVAANEQVIATQQRAIRQLSTPVLQLRSGLLILPIVGALDRERLEQMRAELLQAIRTRRARAVVLDVTGVPEIDTVAANQLIGSVNSARMMGAEVIISGLSAEISQTLVTVGIDLGRVVSAGDLQGGIELAEAGLPTG
jgi:rsbT co-antagonist protein RsbR